MNEFLIMKIVLIFFVVIMIACMGLFAALSVEAFATNRWALGVWLALCSAMTPFAAMAYFHP